jgi:ParB family chromosome partitioning protein
MEIIEVKISDLSRDPANARKHDERNLAATIASFRRFGQQHPIVIDRNNVVRAGNCRLDAAEALGWDTIKAVRSDLSGSDAIAYAIADNRTSELAEWDDDVLAAQLQGLLTDDEALLEAAGFDEDELNELLEQFDADEIEPPGLADGDREPFRQMTFTVHDSQFEVIEAALKAAKSQGGGESVVNENSNGNALAFVCEAFNG